MRSSPTFNGSWIPWHLTASFQFIASRQIEHFFQRVERRRDSEWWAVNGCGLTAMLCRRRDGIEVVRQSERAVPHEAIVAAGEPAQAKRPSQRRQQKTTAKPGSRKTILEATSFG